MRITLVPLACVTLLILIGCADPVYHAAPDRLKAHRGGSASYKIIGTLVKPAGCQAYGFVDGDRIRVEGDPLKKTLGAYDLIRTHHIIRLEVQDLPTLYDALLGPHDGSNDQAVAHIKNSNVIFYLDCGWLYLIGTETQTETTYADAGAEGSAIAVQIIKDATGETHRFYFLKGRCGWVKLKRNGPRKDFVTPETFIDVKSDGSITDPAPIDMTEGFFVDLKDAARAAGLQWWWQPQPQPQPQP